jgi:putative addiction module killer protein
VSTGNFGDVKALGEGLWEMCENFGPSYRMYYTWKNGELIVVLAGGDKSTQSKDIAKAYSWLKNLEDSS